MTLPQWRAEAARLAGEMYPTTADDFVFRRDAFVTGYLACRAVMDEPGEGSVVKLWSGPAEDDFNVAYRVTLPVAREVERWMINGHTTSWSHILLSYSRWALMTDA